MIPKNSANINIVENSRSRLSQPPNPRMHGSISYRGEIRDSINGSIPTSKGKSSTNHFIQHLIENRGVITNKIDQKGQRLTSYTKQKAALNSYNTHRGGDMSLPNLNMRSLKYV